MIHHIGIIGGGKMGTAIFNLLTGFQFRVTWLLRSQTRVEEAKEVWTKKQMRAAKYAQPGASILQESMNRIQITNDLNQLADCDLLIESITEDFEAKFRIFNELDGIVKHEAVFSSNTSSIPIRSLVPSANRKNKFIGIHFFYPVGYKNLLELNILPETSGPTVDSISEFIVSLKIFHKVLKEKDHFLFNRLFLKLQAEVYRLYTEEGFPIIALDDLVKEKLFPVGIFEFFDNVGIDVMLSAITNYSLTTPNAGDYQSLTNGLKKLKDRHHLGIKTGQGFYDYSKKIKTATQSGDFAINTAVKDLILKKIYTSYLVPFFEAVSNHTLSFAEAEYVAMEYTETNKSPFDLAKEIGFIP